MRLVITGANGYIGQRLVRHALQRGFEVTAATRRPFDSSGVKWLAYDLSRSPPPDLFSDAACLIHLAADTSGGAFGDREEEINAAKSLLNATQKHRVRMIFVSSQAARQNAPTSYGRVKSRIEEMVLAESGWVVKPGLVYGGPPAALYGALVALVARWPLLPRLLPSPAVQPIHVDELCEGLLRLAINADFPPRIFCLAGNPVPFSAFLKAISRHRVRRPLYFLPLPASIVDLLLSLFSKNPKIRIALDRIRSLYQLPLMSTASDLQALGLTLRDIADGMHPSGDSRRRLLLIEANALLQYVLRIPPPPSLARRYVRFIETRGNRNPLRLPRVVTAFPSFLSLLPPDFTELGIRMDAATVLSEATPMGASRFLSLGNKCSGFRSTYEVIRALWSEMICRMLRPLVSPFLTLGAPPTQHSDVDSV